MAGRILCPKHKEKTPSCAVYEDGYFCYGCGAYGPLSEIGGIDVQEVIDPEPEDLRRSLERIRKLPVKRVRGLDFPCDEYSYYVVWPDGSYYKRRFLEDRKPKYLSAVGHKKPPFWARTEGKTLFIVEGEINALSVAKAFPDCAVMSPGGSGDFSEARVKNRLKSVLHYSTLIILVDADRAGAEAAINLLAVLAGVGRKAKYLLMQKDANQLLQEGGIDGLKKEVSQLLDCNLANFA